MISRGELTSGLHVRCTLFCCCSQDGRVKTAEKKKCEKHGPATAANGLEFVPFAVEATGAWGERAQKLLAKLAERVGDEAPVGTTWAAPTFTQYWIQRMAVHVQRTRMQAIRAIVARAGRTRERVWQAG